MKGKSFFAFHTFSCDNVEQSRTLNAFFSSPERFVIWTENIIFIFLSIVVPIFIGWVIIHNQSWSVSWNISGSWSSLNTFVSAFFKEVLIRAGFAFFWNKVEIWFIFRAWDTVVILNEWSCFWTWLFSSVHVFIQGTFFSFIRNQNVWLTGNIWFVIFRSSLLAWMSGAVINSSVRTNITLSSGNVKNWSWFTAWNTFESVPERSAGTTAGSVIESGDSVDVIFWNIIHGQTSQNPSLVGNDVCLIWSWSNQKICGDIITVFVDKLLNDTQVSEGIISISWDSLVSDSTFEWSNAVFGRCNFVQDWSFLITSQTLTGISGEGKGWQVFGFNDGWNIRLDRGWDGINSGLNVGSKGRIISDGWLTVRNLLDSDSVGISLVISIMGNAQRGGEDTDECDKNKISKSGCHICKLYLSYQIKSIKYYAI